MTSSDRWVEAKNLIRQQTDIIVNELTELERRVGNQAASIDILQRERDAAVDRWMDTASVKTERENADLRYQVLQLEKRVAEYREYMRLKDRSKIKVEEQRDAAKKRAAEAERVNRIYKDQMHALNEQLRSLEAQNAAQARAYEERGKTIINKDALIRQTSAENGRLLEVIRLGRAGLEGETW